MKLENKKELNRILIIERKLYFISSWDYLSNMIRYSRYYQTWQFQKAFRKAEYYFNKKTSNKYAKLLYLYYERKRNYLGQRLGIDIGFNCFDIGLTFCHLNIICGSSYVGKNCKFHGQNCIGSRVEIGDNCELMVGAKVFAPAKLGNNVTIAAGAVVLGGCDNQDNVLIGGVPARILKKNYKEQNDNNISNY